MSEPQIDVLELFTRHAREVTGKRFDRITYQSTIAELGIDSVAIAELVAKIEDELHIRIPDDDFMQIQTVQDIADLVTALVRQ
jgi:acyl carrier protein